MDDVAAVAAKPKAKAPVKAKPKTQAVAVQTERVPEPPRNDTAALMLMIERAGTDPNFNVEKLSQVMDLYERVEARAAKTAYVQALAEVQQKLPVIAMRGQIVVDAKDNKTGYVTPFAKWEDINETIKPILNTHGFALSFRNGNNAEGRVMVTAVLSHVGGHQEETTMTLPVDASGGKNNVQGIGSSTSYGKRYCTLSLLNITTAGEDDDGKAASERAKREDPYADDKPKKETKLADPKKVESADDWLAEARLWLAERQAGAVKITDPDELERGVTALANSKQFKQIKARDPELAATTIRALEDRVAVLKDGPTP